MVNHLTAFCRTLRGPGRAEGAAPSGAAPSGSDGMGGSALDGRLAGLGLVLLTASLCLSLALRQPVSSPKIIFAWAVWILYGVMSVVMWRHMLSPRQTAWLAVVGFIVPFVSLWLVAGK